MKISNNVIPFNFTLKSSGKNTVRDAIVRDSSINSALKIIRGEDNNGNARETQLQKQTREARDSIRQMQAMFSPKQQASNKVGQLKQRLDLLKSMVMRMAQIMTPSQAKNIARELKGIARELAAAAKTLNGGNEPQFNSTVPDTELSVDGVGINAGGGGDANSGDVASAEQAAKQAEAQASQAAKEAAAELGASKTEEDDGEGEETQDVSAETTANRESDAGNSTTRTTNAGNANSDDPADKSLRAALAEASKTFKEILGMLKAYLNDKQGKKDVEEMEKNLKDVDRALETASSRDDFYDMQGAVASAAESVGNVDVSA